MYKLEDGVVNGEKISERVFASEHPVIKERIKRISDIKYDLYSHEENYFDKDKPIFTIIIIIYDATLRYIKESLTSAFQQNYFNTEVVIVNNGTSGEIGKLLWDTFITNKNSKLIRTYENLYDPDANELDAPFPNLLNAALFCSVGDYINFLSYDDSFSLDYVSRMVELFVLNPNCSTAAPMFISVNENSKINYTDAQIEQARKSRGKYTDGVVLARSYMRNEKLIVFAGELLCFKSELMLKYGGFDHLSDYGQLFRFAIHGDSGFDPDARLYWRHHSQQANQIQTRSGIIYYKYFINFMETYNIYELHKKIAGCEFADEFLNYFNKLAEKTTITSFRDSYGHGLKPGLIAFKNIILQCPVIFTLKILPYFVIDFHLMIYRNYIPSFLKKIYRSLK